MRIGPLGCCGCCPVRSRASWVSPSCSRRLVGVVSLVAVLWLTALVMAGGATLSAHDARQLWGLWGLACAEGLGWGILCSLAIRSPLRATLLAVVAVSLVNQFGVTLTQTHDLGLIASYVEAVPFRLAALLALGCGCRHLAFAPLALEGNIPTHVGRESRDTDRGAGCTRRCNPGSIGIQPGGMASGLAKLAGGTQQCLAAAGRGAGLHLSVQHLFHRRLFYPASGFISGRGVGEYSSCRSIGRARRRAGVSRRSGAWAAISGRARRLRPLGLAEPADCLGRLARDLGRGARPVAYRGADGGDA